MKSKKPSAEIADCESLINYVQTSYGVKVKQKSTRYSAVQCVCPVMSAASQFVCCVQLCLPHQAWHNSLWEEHPATEQQTISSDKQGELLPNRLLIMLNFEFRPENVRGVSRGWGGGRTRSGPCKSCRLEGNLQVRMTVSKQGHERKEMHGWSFQ
jgi:hypothetical protein